MSNGQVDWKAKYLEIRRTMISAMNMAFRDGYEQGSNDTQMQNMQQQMVDMQNQQAQAAAAGMGGQPGPGQPGSDGGPAAGGPGDIPQDDGSGGNPPPPGGSAPGQDSGVPMANANPSMNAVPPQNEELDQYLGELDQVISKSEKPDEKLLKSLEKIKLFRMNTKMAHAMNLRKAEKKPTPKALIPRILPRRAAANLSQASKTALHTQQSIVDGLMKKWESETAAVTSEVMNVVGTEPLAKKE